MDCDASPRPTARKRQPHADRLGPLEAAARKRIAARERTRRYRAAHPEKIRTANAQPKARKPRDPNLDRERRQELYFRFNSRASVMWCPENTSNLSERSALVLWMDPQGELHAEDERSAEEVIRDWKREQKKKAKGDPR
jgi:hypothetical protein